MKGGWKDKQTEIFSDKTHKSANLIFHFFTVSLLSEVALNFLSLENHNKLWQ
jgi:hypothetical protein